MTNNQQIEYTATDLRNNVCNHNQFYEQFVNEAVLRIVTSAIGEERIKQSTCEHFNDIPIFKWDRLEPSIKHIIDTAKWKRLFNTTYGEKDKNSFIWSVSCGVCIAKAAARIIKSTPNQ